MPGAIIVINQDRPGPTTSNGTPGIARKDLWQSRTIRPVCSTSGNSSLEWTLLDVPAGSAAVIAGTETAPYFTPDLPGPYRLLLVTNGGGPGNMQVLICGVTFDEDGVEIDGGAILPAYGEEGGESNWAGNERGWATSLEFVLTDTRARLTTLEETPAGGAFSRPHIVTAEVDYHLDEASGTIINHGTLGAAANMGVGAASTASVRYGYPGPFGDGLRMPTGSTLESPAVATAATTQMTIWAWVMTLTDSPSVCSVLAYTKTAAVSHLFSLSVGINGSLYVQYDNGSGGQQALNGYSEEIILRQRPTLISVVYDVTPVSAGDRGFTGYIDGVKVGFYNLSGTVNFATSARWQLGSTNGVAQTLNAIVFAAGSAPSALTAADIKQMYREGKAYP